jgi:hypothetical protein
VLGLSQRVGAEMGAPYGLSSSDGADVRTKRHAARSGGWSQATLGQEVVQILG